ncbi:unnamed protein product [Boreogadus saida]
MLNQLPETGPRNRLVGEHQETNHSTETTLLQVTKDLLIFNLNRKFYINITGSAQVTSDTTADYNFTQLYISSKAINSATHHPHKLHL